VNTADEFLKAAQELERLRLSVKPLTVDNPERDLRSLVCYHLAVAAHNCLRIAEARAARERDAAATSATGAGA